MLIWRVCLRLAAWRGRRLACYALVMLRAACWAACCRRACSASPCLGFARSALTSHSALFRELFHPENCNSVMHCSNSAQHPCGLSSTST
jgi:hypothetical protein